PLLSMTELISRSQSAKARWAVRSAHESGGDYFSELGGEIISESGGGLPRNLHSPHPWLKQRPTTMTS
ncbi:hypothetical protein GOC79_33065, partial [Sinorhizobium medicae]|nr:hypothetical protein [Sinorhizobium medicae]